MSDKPVSAFPQVLVTAETTKPVAPERGRSVDELEISVRSAGILAAAEITTVEELAGWTEKDIRSLPNATAMVVRELLEVLEELGLSFKPD